LKAALLVTLGLASGCSLFAPKGPSDVARGEYYAAGKPEFDSFFIVLHDKQVELLAAPQEPSNARQNLTLALGLTADASDESLKERLSQELKKLAAQGLRMRLDVPAPTPALDASTTLYASETSINTPLRAALPQEGTRLVRSRNRMLKSKLELEKLNVTGITLEGSVDQAFRVEGPWKRDEVRRNLTDGQKVITIMQARAQEVADLDQKLLSLLTEVVSTDPTLGKAPTYAPPPPADDRAKAGRRAAAAKTTPAAKPNSGSATPVSAKPAPSPATKPAPKRGDDDAAPAPKPTQGNAPAEIEP
jgi:hypothetical protein